MPNAMSMIGNFRSLSDDDLRALLENPARVEQLLYGDDLFAGTNGEVVSLFGGPTSQPPSEPDEWEQDGDADEIDVDKAWHGIHFLLTGTAWEGTFPLNFIVSGGKEVGDVDVGYGPARALTSEDVRRLDAALEPLTSEELERRFDPKQMSKLQIYPEIWADEDDDSLEYLIEYYTELRAFVRRAAERGDALLVYLN
jgi:Domain of unknown function (DUF1877)